MLSVLSLFVLAVVSQEVGLLDEWLMQGTYDEQDDRARNTFSVWRVDDFKLDAWGIHKAKLFRTSEEDMDSDEGVYVGTSKYDNYETYLGEQPIFAWDSDEKGWERVSVHPTIRSGAIDYQAVVNYFHTADGNLWAYDALWQVQNNTLRSTAVTTGWGPSYILGWDEGSQSFSGTPSFTHTTAFATEDSTYFATQDGREFLWTFSWGQNNPKRTSAPPNCTLIEYGSGGGSWVVNDGRFIGCLAAPRAPLVFDNVDGRRIYLFTSSGAGGVLFLDYNTASKNFTRVDLMDNLALPGLIQAWHWKDEAGGYDTFDMITATTTSGVITIRLHWDIHWAETLPAVRASQGAPNDLTWIWPTEGRRCFVIGGAERGYGGLQSTPGSIYSWYMEVWCWDQAHDVWDNALRIPHEAAWFNQAFRDPSDDNEWWLVTLQQHHVVNSAMKTYHFSPEDDRDVRIHIGLETGSEIAEDTQWRGHDTRHIAIATLSIVAFALVLALLTLFLLASGGGGGGGSGDYSKFN